MEIIIFFIFSALNLFLIIFNYEKSKILYTRKYLHLRMFCTLIDSLERYSNKWLSCSLLLIGGSDQIELGYNKLHGTVNIYSL